MFTEASPPALIDSVVFCAVVSLPLYTPPVRRDKSNFFDCPDVVIVAPVTLFIFKIWVLF